MQTYLPSTPWDRVASERENRGTQRLSVPMGATLPQGQVAERDVWNLQFLIYDEQMRRHLSPQREGSQRIKENSLSPEMTAAQMVSRSWRLKCTCGALLGSSDGFTQGLHFLNFE